MQDLQQMEDIENGTLKIVGCNHDGSDKVYYYASVYDDLKDGDMVWVENPSTQTATGGYMMTRVVRTDVSIKDYQGPVVKSYIVAKFDDSRYKQYLDRKRLANELLRKMEEQFANSARLARFEAAAKSDPAMAKLMEQYRELVSQ